jgi:hypothetical protein
MAAQAGLSIISAVIQVKGPGGPMCFLKRLFASLPVERPVASTL